MAEVTRLDRHGMVTLRGAWDDLAAPLEAEGLAVPEQRRISDGAGAAVAWMSPDEGLVLCDHAAAPGMAARIGAAEGFVTALDVSDARAVFDVTGEGADDVLAKLSPADLAAVEAHEMRRSRLAQVAAAFWRIDGGWRVVCFRSVGTYVEDLLVNAARGPALG